MATAQDTIAVARRYKGVTEHPSGSNHQQFGVWYGMDHVAWCAIFASYCLYVAGYRWVGATTAKGFSYCPSILDWGRRNGRLSRTPHLGDLALWIHNGVAHHVEIVTAVGAGVFTSIGGNTGSGNLANGGEVVEHQHGTSEWVFVSPVYSRPSPHPAPAPGKAVSPVHRNLALTSPLTTGADVKWVQSRLIALKLLPAGSADGQFGPRTHNAVVAFQRRAHLTVDGVCGPVTGVHLANAK